MNPCRSIRFQILVLIVTGFCFLIPQKVSADYVTKLLVKSGDVAPGTTDAVFNTSSWNPPTPIGISEAGDVLFLATLEVGIGGVTSENSLGLWVYEPAVKAVRLVARVGDEVPGLTGATFTYLNLDHTFMSLSGQTGLYASYEIAGVEEEAFFMEARGTSGNGTLLRKVYLGMEILPAWPGATLANFSPVAYNNGRLLFTARFVGEGITSNWDDLFLCLYQPGGISILARKGDPMPAVGNEYVIASVGGGMYRSPLDDFGGTIMQLEGHKTVSPNIQAAFYTIPGSPDLPLAIAIQDENKIITGTNRLNSKGQMARRGYVPLLGYATTTIWSGPVQPTGETMIAAVGDFAPGAGTETFEGISDFVIFDDGSVAFQGHLSDGKSGIWINDENGLKKSIMSGDQAPGLEDGMHLTRVLHWMANRAGKVAFADFADNGTTGFGGIWIGNNDGYEPVSLEDDTVEIAEGVFRTIEGHFAQHIWFTRTGADGYSALLNDSNMIAFGVTFYEGGNALLMGSPGGLVVNSVFDREDEDITDGRCATGRLLPDGRPECTLRAAIMEANAQSGFNKITFDIDEDPVIAPWDPLPFVKDSVSIDGLTQPRFGSVVIDGAQTPAGTNGLRLDGEYITVQGLNIGRFEGSGLFIGRSIGRTVGHNKVFGCNLGYLTVDDDDFGNSGHGLHIESSSDNQIGGTEDWQRNYISNNHQNGIQIDLISRRNLVINNEVGSLPDEEGAGNSGYGIAIEAVSDSNVIGGMWDSANFVSGNLLAGIGIKASGQNLVKGNYIHNNQEGVLLHGSAWNNIIINNFIGLIEDSTVDGNLNYGVRITSGSDSNLVGGETDSGNVISGNGHGGVLIERSNYNRISGNYIGTDPGGAESMANHGDGILVDQARGNIIGETYLGLDKWLGDGNLISGNDSAGITLINQCDSTTIASNLIGIDKNDEGPLSNQWGLRIFDSPRTFIGHNGKFDVSLPNTIKENMKTGILLLSDSCSVVANKIVSNGVSGVDPGGDGILIDGLANLIGTNLFRNRIMDNIGAAVVVIDNIDHSNNSNQIQFNRIFGNIDGGIDLSPVGINPDDNLDSDDGPNRAQNAPKLVSVTVTLSKMVIIKGTLHSQPNQQYHITGYENPECAFEGLEEGEFYRFEGMVETDASGNALIDITYGPLIFDPPVAMTMLAMDSEGNTSEFSNCLYIWTQPEGVDLVLDKTDHADSATVGIPFTYEMTIANVGSDTARSVELIDSLPAYLTYISDSTDQGLCSFIDQTLTCDLGKLPPGDATRVFLTVSADTVGQIVNLAEVSSEAIDVNPASNVDDDTTFARDTETGVNDWPSTLPKKFSLAQNYPNPFNPTTEIAYALPFGADVELSIFNILGEEVRLLNMGHKAAGYHSLSWDGLNQEGQSVSSGIYFYRLSAGGLSETKKMVLMK